MGEAWHTAWQTALHRSYKLVVEHRAPKIMPKRPQILPTRQTIGYLAPAQAIHRSCLAPAQAAHCTLPRPCSRRHKLVACTTSLWSTPTRPKYWPSVVHLLPGTSPGSTLQLASSCVSTVSSPRYPTSHTSPMHCLAMGRVV